MGTKEIAQRNGKLGGRPVGSKSTPADLKAAAKRAVEDFYAKHAMEIAKHQLAIAFKGQFEPTRLQALHHALDRVIGKPIQPVATHVEGNITISVVTGVPRGRIIEHGNDGEIPRNNQRRAASNSDGGGGDSSDDQLEFFD